MGAAKVIATDINELSLALLRDGAVAAGVESIVETKIFDFADPALPLPGPTSGGLLVCADLLYNAKLAKSVGERCGEALGRSTELLVTDSQRFDGGQIGFMDGFHAAVATDDEHTPALAWRQVTLERITGSGILIDEDQTCNFTTQYFSRWVYRGE